LAYLNPAPVFQLYQAIIEPQPIFSINYCWF